MKFALIALVATVYAANKSPTQEFPSNCFSGAKNATTLDPYVACSGATICCAFKEPQGSELKRCMTSA